MHISLRPSRPLPAAARAAASLLGILALAPLSAAAATVAGAPAVATARLLDLDPAAVEVGSGYLVEIDDVLHGAVPGGVLAVRLRPDDALGRRLAAEAMASGEPLELTLVPEADGSFRATAVRAVGGGEPVDPFPPPLAAPPDAVAAGRSADLRRLAGAATAGAPFEHQVLEIVNEERLANGNLPPLKGVGLLDDAAGGHSFNMDDRDFFAHCDPDTFSQPGTRMTAAGYNWNAAAENIAAGQPTPQAVMAAWMASFGHRTNILSTTYRELGVGHSHDPGDLANVRLDQNGDCVSDQTSGPFDHYWTQNFGRRGSPHPAVYPVVIERELYETACADVDLYTYGAGAFSQMRFSNDNATWSAWMPFSPDVEWTLDPGASGTATVWAQLGNGSPAHTASDTIVLTAGYPAASTLDLSAQTVTTTESWQACDTITAGDGFHVAASGDVTFTARTIVLTDGFSVASGGTFRAITR